MKRYALLVLIFIADLFLPEIETGAQVTIAPLVVAAIGAIGTMAAAAQEAEAQKQAGAAAASGNAAGKKGGISIAPTFSPQGLAPSGGQQPADKKQAAVQAADLASVDSPKFQGAATLKELEAQGLFQGKEMLKKKKSENLDQKIQMAAMAAQLGSALFQGGQGPPPPGVPRGGGIGIKPVFQNTARDLYGG